MNIDSIGNEEKPKSPEDELFIELQQIASDKLRDRTKSSAERRAVHSKSVDFANDLRGKYGIVIETYRIFHIVSGSTPDENIATHFDLPDGEIEKFIREEL
jgi:hypothetical protein